MFRDEKPTSQLDPDEVQRLIAESAPPKLAHGSGGMAPADDWCGPTRTMDPVVKQALIATTEPERPAPAAAAPISHPELRSSLRATTIVLFLLLVAAGAAAIAARTLHLF